MRTIKKQHVALSSPIADLVTYRAIPTPSVHYIDPFLFLNHHGPQHYPPNNYGLPFGPHPHRGFETVTFVLAGDILHRDSGGNTGIIKEGGVQWMTAGRGLIHEEISSEKFKAKGGPLEILQLWVNLPARYKMTEPHYVDLQKGDIPSLTLDEGRVIVNVISGKWKETEGAYQSITDIHLATIFLKKGAKFDARVPVERNIFFYVVKGKLKVNSENTESLRLIEFNEDAEEVKIEAFEDSIILFGHALPYNEPVVSQGPFVMNTEEEIRQAYDDYRAGKFG